MMHCQWLPVQCHAEQGSGPPHGQGQGLAGSSVNCNAAQHQQLTTVNAGDLLLLLDLLLLQMQMLKVRTSRLGC